MPHEVIIDNPPINPEPRCLTSYTYYRGRELISMWLERANVHPDTHPKVIDLCAGDGSVAQLLIELGWDASDIECVDIAKPHNPLSSSVSWQYWNLVVLARTIQRGDDISPQIAQHAKSFDIVAIMQALFFLKIKTRW